MSDPSQRHVPMPSRRSLLRGAGFGLGALALHQLVRGQANPTDTAQRVAKAKRVIYLFQAGGPSQFETLDPKPLLRSMHGQALPESVRAGQRLTGMSGNQAVLPIAASFANFVREPKTGIEYSELLSHTAKVAEHLCVLRGVHTEAINHDPAITFFCSGSPIAGRPSMGAWLSYGLGSMNANLPTFVVLVSKDAARDQPLYSRLWGSGFLPSEHQGVRFRSGKDAVLYLNDPEGSVPSDRRAMLDALGGLSRAASEREDDPEIDARLAQAELAFRMQTSVPEATSLSGESDATFERYGAGSRDPGTFAANCLLARRLVERGVRFVQLFHQGWDQHGGLPAGISHQCRQTDQPAAALVADLAERGLLDETLVVWGGEFGRTTYCQGRMTVTDYGRDHHPRCFSMWLAGGGVRGGMVHGATDDFSYNIVQDGVHVHDLHATLLHLLGIDHERLTWMFQGRHYRLTDVHGRIVKPILS